MSTRAGPERRGALAPDGKMGSKPRRGSRDKSRAIHALGGENPESDWRTPCELGEEGRPKAREWAGWGVAGEARNTSVPVLVSKCFLNSETKHPLRSQVREAG